MKVSTVLGLAVATGVLAAAALGISIERARDLPVDRQGDKVFPDLGARIEDVTKITILNKVRLMTFEKTENGWVAREFADYPVRLARVRETLIGLADLAYAEPKTRNPEKFKRLDLAPIDAEDSRSRVVTVYDATGQKLAEIVAGKVRYNLVGVPNQGIYFRLPDESGTWLGRGMFAPVEDPMRWLDRTIADFPSTKWKKITLRNPKGAEIVLTRGDGEKAELIVANAPKGRKVDGGWSVGVIGNVFTSLEFEDVKKLGDVDFEKNPVWTGRFEAADGLVLTVAMADENAEYWAKFTASAEAGASDEAKQQAKDIAGRVEGWAYRLISYKATPIKTDMKELLADGK